MLWSSRSEQDSSTAEQSKQIAESERYMFRVFCYRAEAVSISCLFYIYLVKTCFNKWSEVNLRLCVLVACRSFTCISCKRAPLHSSTMFLFLLFMGGGGGGWLLIPEKTKIEFREEKEVAYFCWLWTLNLISTELLFESSRWSKIICN